MPAVVCKRIEICKTDPVHVVPIDAPVSFCEQFQCFHVCIIYVEEESPTSLCVPSGQKNALDILMASSREVVLPPLLSPLEKWF